VKSIARTPLRWDLEICDGESGSCRAKMVKVQFGDFVLFSAYETINAARADLKKEVADLRKRIAELEAQLQDTQT
jgi:hypothetical protein